MKLEIIYTELSGPNGYGCQCPEVSVEGSLNDIIREIHKWIGSSMSIFGPDPRDIKDYFKNCRAYIDGHQYLCSPLGDLAWRLYKEHNIIFV